MSTLPGQASKGEKTKQKFQSLDINNLYRVSRGENLEKQQQKTSLSYIKHGMQSLGKVPSARRAPANLPSLKSEHSGTDAAVPLIPPGAPGWGKQDPNLSNPPSSSTTPSTSTTSNSTSATGGGSQPSTTLSSHQAAIALPVTTTIPPHPKQATLSATPATTDKLWSSVMSGSDPLHPPPYQSPQFQHEFPSLSAGDGGPTRTGSDAQYPSGLSLRPQTEGSWTQGGARPDPPRGSAALGAPPQLQVPVGQQALPPQFRGVMPPFMYKGSFQQGGQQGAASQGAQPPVNGRARGDSRPPRLTDSLDEITPRPIIREEELNRMDEISTDWALQDEIDYNQKLAFSDDESDQKIKKDNKREAKSYGRSEKEAEKSEHSENQPRGWGRTNSSRGRSSEDEDIWMQRRSQQDKEIEIAVQRAKQRKEEEEKRFNEERKQGAAKKLMELEEKIQKRDREQETPKANHAENIPLPEFQKDKDRDGRARTPNDSEDKSRDNNFRQLTQIEGKNLVRAHKKPEREREKERDGREQNGPSFSKHFQSDLPPRFQKHPRNNSSSNLNQPHYNQYDNRWGGAASKSGQGSGRAIRGDSPERDGDDRRDFKRQGSDEYRGSHHGEREGRFEESHEGRHHDYDYNRREDDKWQKDKVDKIDDWHDRRKERDEKSQDRFERPQRPDSRDSRSTRDSRHSRDSGRESESRDYMPWAEQSYEEKRREQGKDDRRAVPGPITKERIEAEDLRDEKRSLTQLKRGQIIDKKTEAKTEKDDKKDGKMSSAWADAIPTSEDAVDPKFMEDKVGSLANDKGDQKHFGQEKKDKDLDRFGRNRGYSQSKGWSREGSSSEYHRQGWGKRASSRGHKGSQRPSSGIGGEAITDSEGSNEEHIDGKGLKKTEKDEKNKFDKASDKKGEKRENYVPKGEPSRHGRGGGTFGRSGRLSGLSKKIDGYGPPTNKSPFGHHDEKEKKVSSDEATAEVDDKSKQAPAAPIGSRKEEKGRKSDSRRGKPRNKHDELYETNSENSDEKDGKKKLSSKSGRGGSSGRRGNAPARVGGSEKRFEGRADSNRQGSGVKKDDKDQNLLCNAINDGLKNRDSPDTGDDKDEKTSLNGDTEGFQEVKSKKTGKERSKTDEKGKSKDKDKPDRSKGKGSAQLTQQQIQNIPSLMATIVNPPPVLPQTKSQFDRPRQSKLAPRFAKQKLQKAQMQHASGGGVGEVGDIGKMNQNMNVYGIKDSSGVAPSVCAWDKPLSSQLRNMDHDNMLGVAIDSCKNLEQPQSPGQGSDKMLNKLQDKAHLDGATPPVNTIIFENTNFKSAPGSRNNRNEKPRSKMDDGMDNGMMTGFNKPMTDLLKDKSNDTIQLPLSFKEDSGDMKLDFFGSDLSHLTDDKNSKNLCMPKSMHAITSSSNSNSMMCSADSLNMKIASVKKVWETSEHSVGQDDNSSFSNSFVTDPHSPNVFNKGEADDTHEGYSPSPNQPSSTTTNVCKVKPTQQVSGGSGQTVLSSTNHQQHSGVIAPGLMGNPLSPPPMQPVLGAAGVGIGPSPQQFTANISYQAGLGGSTQYGMSAIPSPPTVPVLYNSTQQLQPQTGMYGPFQIDQSGVLGGQGRSQYSQYANHFGLGQTASSPYNQQSMYLQTAPPHPPPNPQAPPEMFQNMNTFRQFGQSQQLNNPSTVLISSTSNSLMSASVKPSTQQISAIGTKAGGVGQAYQQQSQQGQQVYMYDPSLQANYLPSAGVMQRGPGGPVQNSVVPGLQPSSSYYSGSTGGQTGYFQQPGNSTLQSAQLQQHQSGYGLQGNVFGSHNQSHTNTAMQSFNSHFLTSPIQMAAALNQQYRSTLQTTYMKGVSGQQIGDQSGRPQQLKSPGSQEVLSSVFSGSQIPSPKSRQNSKHPPPQSSPTAQHKYNLYQAVGNQQSNVQRYIAPIQRPVNFQQNLGSVQQNNMNNQKHRSNSNNKAPNNRQYYGNQNNSLSQNEKVEDAKLNDAGATLTSSTNSSSNSVIASKTIGTSSSSSVTTDNVKDTTITKEETSALKD